MSDKRKIEIVNEALIKIRQRDSNGIYVLYDEIAHTLRFIALKYLKNNDDADDLIQDFWADIYVLADKFVYQRNGYAFLCKAMTRKAINRYKKLHGKTEISILSVDYSLVDKEAGMQLDNTENRIMVDKAISELSEIERLIIQETYFEDKTIRAIARDTKISKTHVGRIKMQAIEKLKTFFADYKRDKI